MNPGLRYLPQCLLIGLCGLLVWLRSSGNLTAYAAVLAVFGMDMADTPFLDMHALTSAIECLARGVDVLTANPCDVMGRPHVYPRAWLYLAALPIDRGTTILLGLAIGVAFLAGLFVLLRVDRPREIAPLILSLASPAVMLALERGNNDIIVWLLVLAATRMVVGGGAARAAAYGLAWIAALLKLYPLALLVLAVRERLPVCLTLLAGLGGSATLLLLDDITRPYRFFQAPEQNATGSYLWDAFGARNIAAVLLDGGIVGRDLYVVALLSLVSAYSVLLAVRMVRHYGLRPSVADLQPAIAAPMMAGAALIIGCFFAGLSIEYRAIHLLFALPGAQYLWRAAKPGPVRRLAGAMAWMIAWVMWSGAAYTHLYELTGSLGVPEATRIVINGVGAAAREIAWWWLVSALMALLLCLVAASPSGRVVVRDRHTRLPGG